MPTQLVQAGGSRGPQEFGQEYNSALTANIIKLAEQTTSRNITETKAKQYIQGQARVAQGESLATIRASQGVFDKIFGRGTMQGAEAQTVIQATDTHVMAMQDNMHKYKAMSTEEFISEQENYVTSNLLTGDPNVDAIITMASSEAISDATRQHSKVRALHVQEKNKIAFETTLTGSSKRVHAALKDPNMDLLDKYSAVHVLRARLAPMPGQTDEAYRKSISDSMLAELKAGRPELYQGLVKGGYQVGEDFIETGEPMLFDANTTAIHEEAYIQYQGKSDTAAAMRKSRSMAKLKEASINPTITDTEFSNLYDEVLGVEGADFLTTPQGAALFINRGKAKLTDTSKTTGVQEIISGDSVTDTDRKKVANNLNLVEAKFTETVAELPPEEQEVGLENAARAMIDLSIQNNEVPTGWTTQWNTGFANLLNGKGEPSPVFLKTLQHFNSKYDAKPALFAKGMDKTSLASALGVKQLMQNYDMDPEEAVLQYSTYKLPYDEAKKLANSKEYNSKIDKFMDNPEQRGWFSNLFFGDWSAVKEKGVVQGIMKQMIANNIAMTGDVGEGVWEASVADFMNTHEDVQDYAAPNHGVPLREQAGMTSPDSTFDDAMTHWLYNVAPDKFGPGFDPDKVRLNFTPGFVSIQPIGEDGRPLPGILNSNQKIDIKEIGSTFNTDVTNPSITEAITDRIIGPTEAGRILQGIQENKQAVEFAKGGPVTGDANDVAVYKTLQDPSKGKRLMSMLKNIPQQLALGKMLDLAKTINAVAKITSFNAEDDTLVDAALGTEEVPVISPESMKTTKKKGDVVTPDIVQAVINQESSNRPEVVSSKGAVGLMQLLPSTASEVAGRKITAEDLKDPELNKELGTKYLTKLVNKHGLASGLAAYNAGEGALLPSRDCPGLARWECEWDNKEHTIPNTGYNETRNYVKSILGNL